MRLARRTGELAPVGWDLHGLAPSFYSTFAVDPSENAWVAGWRRGQYSKATAIYRIALGRKGLTSNPFLELEPDCPTETAGVWSPCPLKRDGLEFLWYAASAGGPSKVHLAIRRTGEPWRKKGVVLDAGETGSADSEGASHPFVLVVGDLFVMVYEGIPARSLLVATSRNGRNWKKKGHLLFRGSAKAPDGAEVADPQVMPRGDGQFNLQYSGRSARGQWGAFSVCVPASSLLGYSEPIQLSRQAQDAISGTLSAIPKGYLSLRLGPKKYAPGWRSVDPPMTQLFPSSTPVFSLDLPREHLIIKLGRSPHFVEREFDRALALRGLLPTPSMVLRYVQQQPVLISRRLAQPSLAALARRSPEQFSAAIESLADVASRALMRTMTPYNPAVIEFSTQTPNLVLQRLERFFALARSQDRRFEALRMWGMTDDGVRIPPIASQIGAALREVARAPRWMAFFDGDVKLNHLFYGRQGELTAIDVEYSGWYDIDWIAHLILMAAIAPSGESLEVELLAGGKGYRTVWKSEGPLRELVRSFRVPHRLSNLSLNRKRVLAYLMHLVAHQFLYGDEPDETIAGRLGRDSAIKWYPVLYGSCLALDESHAS